MGQRVETNRRKVEEAKETEERGREMGEKDASEISQIKGILEGIDKNLDEDIVNSIEVTRESAKSEAVEHMESEVRGILEQGYASAAEAIQEGQDQAARSAEAAAEFQSVSGVSEFGRSAAESAAENANRTAEEFTEQAETAEIDMEESRDNHSSLLDDIRA